MCVDDVVIYDCGHPTVPVIRSCVLAKGGPQFPFCANRPENRFLAGTMCLPCEEIAGRRWVLVRSWECEYYHERRLCGCILTNADGGARICEITAVTQDGSDPYSGSSRFPRRGSRLGYYPDPLPDYRQSYGLLYFAGTKEPADQFAARWLYAHRLAHQNDRCGCDAEFIPVAQMPAPAPWNGPGVNPGEQSGVMENPVGGGHMFWANSDPFVNEPLGQAGPAMPSGAARAGEPSPYPQPAPVEWLPPRSPRQTDHGLQLGAYGAPEGESAQGQEQPTIMPGQQPNTGHASQPKGGRGRGTTGLASGSNPTSGSNHTTDTEHEPKPPKTKSKAKSKPKSKSKGKSKPKSKSKGKGKARSGPKPPSPRPSPEPSPKTTPHPSPEPSPEPPSPGLPDSSAQSSTPRQAILATPRIAPGTQHVTGHTPGSVPASRRSPHMDLPAGLEPESTAQAPVPSWEGCELYRRHGVPQHERTRSW